MSWLHLKTLTSSVPCPILDISRLNKKIIVLAATTTRVVLVKNSFHRTGLTKQKFPKVVLAASPLTSVFSPMTVQSLVIVKNNVSFLELYPIKTAFVFLPRPYSQMHKYFGWNIQAEPNHNAPIAQPQSHSPISLPFMEISQRFASIDSHGRPVGLALTPARRVAGPLGTLHSSACVGKRN